MRVDDSRLDTVEESQPSFAANGVFLSVVYTRGGSGDRDIWSARATAPNSWGDWTQVSDGPAGSTQENPELVSDGTWVYAVWQDNRLGSNHIFFSRSSDGMVWGDGDSGNDNDIRVDDSTAAASAPTIALLGPGNLVVAWEDMRLGNGATKIYASYSGDGGLNWDAALPVDDGTPTTSALGPAAASSGASVHVVWQDQRNDEGDIFHSAFDGVSWSVNARVDDDMGGSRGREPAIVAGVSGNPMALAVVWSDNRLGTEVILASGSPDGGTTWGDGLSDNDPQVDGGGVNGPQRHPDLTAMPGIMAQYELAVIWQDDRNGDPDIYASLYDNLGSFWTVAVRVNDDGLGYGFSQTEVTLAKGGAGIGALWTDTREGNGDVMGSSWNGLSWGDGFYNDNDIVAAGWGTSLGGEQEVPQVAYDSGTYYAVWRDTRDPDLGGAPDRNIYFSRSADGGTTWGDGMPGNNNDVRVDDGPLAANAEYVDLAVSPTGRIVAVYQDSRSGAPQIFATWSDNQGTIWGDGHINSNDVRVNMTLGNKMRPVVAITPTGTVFAAWEDYRVGTPDIFVARSLDGGQSWSPSVRANTNGVGGQIDPAIAVNGSTVYVTWAHQVSGGNYDIWFGASFDSGATWPIQRKVDDDPGLSPQTNPAMSVDRTGRIVIAWRDQRSGSWEIRSSSSKNNGNTWGDGDPANDNDLIVNSDPGPAVRGAPALIAGSATYAVWPDDRAIATSYDAWGSRLDPGALGWTPNDLVNDPAFQPAQQVDPDAALTATDVGVLWSDNRLGGYHAYFSRAPQESPLPPLPPTLGRIDIVPWPGPTVLEPSQTQGYTAQGWNTDNSPNSTWVPVWGTTDSLGTVFPSGYSATYQANLLGTDNITIDAQGTSLSNRSLIRIEPSPPLPFDPLARIELTPWPGPVRLTPTATRVFTAIGYNLLGGQNLTWTPTWTRGPLGTVSSTGGDSSSGWTATFDAGTSLGSTSIRVEGNGGAVWNSTAIEVIVGPVSILTLVPVGPLNRQPTQSANFTALGYDAWIHQNTSWTASWSALNPLGTATDTGGSAATGFTATFTAGTATGASGLRASVAGNPAVNRSAIVNIVPGPLFSITLTPSSLTVLAPAGSQTYNALGYDAWANKNLSWLPAWGTSDSRGWANSTGGNPTSGFTALYTAGASPGSDNITVRPTSGPNPQAASPIQIVILPPFDPLDRIELTPWPGPVTLSPTASTVFTAIGYDLSGLPNTTWVPEFTYGSAGSVTGSSWVAATQSWSVTYTAGTAAMTDTLTVHNGTASNSTDLAVVPGPPDTITLDPWPGPVTLKPTRTASFLSFVYDFWGNLNDSWSPSWNPVNALGTLGGFGGDPVSGFTATFTAGTVTGLSGVEVHPVGYIDVAKTTSVVIEPGPLHHIDVAPPGPLNLTVGATQPFTAFGYDQWDNRNTTWSAAWLSVNGRGNVGNQSGNPAAGFTATYTALTPGNDQLRVEDDGIKSNVDITIPAPPAPSGGLQFIDLTPAAVTVSPGAAATFTAVGYDGPGIRNTTWRPLFSLLSPIGNLGPMGGDASAGWTVDFTAGFVVGGGTLRVQSETNASLTNQSSITIQGSGRLFRIHLTPWPSISLQLNQTQEFVAQAFDAGDNLNTTWSPSWNVAGGIGAVGSPNEPVPGEHHATFSPGNLGAGTVRVDDAPTGVQNGTAVTLVDLTPPISAVNPLPLFSTIRSLQLPYTASDAGGAGLASVGLWYRHNGGTWSFYGTVTPFTAFSFSATADGLYEFYSVATDNATNGELPPSNADASVTVDSTAPTISATTPGNAAAGVSPTTTIVLGFSEAVSRAAFESAAAVLAGGRAVTGTWTWNGNEATFTPTVPFPEGAVVEVSVPDTAVRDAAGNRMASPLQFSFSIVGATTDGGGLPAGLWGFLILLAAIIAGLFLALAWARRRKKGQEEGDAGDRPDESTPAAVLPERSSALPESTTPSPARIAPTTSATVPAAVPAGADVRGCTQCAAPLSDPANRFFCQCGEPYHASCATELGTCPSCKRVMTPEVPASAIEVVDCPLCSEGNALPQGADPASTWCTACGAPLRELKRGYNHLIITETPEPGYRWANGLLRQGVGALILSKTFPDKITKDYGLTDAEIFWLSDTTPAPNVLDPKRIDFEIMRAIGKFVKATRGGVVLLDGVETLVVENGFDKVYRFLRKVTDLCGLHEITLIVPVAPGAFETEQFATLTKAFDHAEQLAPVPTAKPKRRKKKAAPTDE